MIQINLSLYDILEDINNVGHKAFMNAGGYCDEASRKAMTERIAYYKNLINEGKIKIIYLKEKMK